MATKVRKSWVRHGVLTLVVLLATVVALIVPTGFDREYPGERVKVRVLAADNGALRQFGLVKTGDQVLRVRILSGGEKGREVEAVNHLTGRLEFDRVYGADETALATLNRSRGNVLTVTVIDYYRLESEAMILALFALLLVGFGGWTGARSLLSFFFTAVMLWKVLLPGMLRGWDPIVSSLCVSALLCVVIILLVSGVDRKGIVAVLGSLSGLAVTCGLALVFGRLFSVHGAVKPFSETLLYSGFGHLDLTGIFLGGIFLASSGAVMDLAMDIASALHELVRKNPSISRRELIVSGLSVGRMVIGTMTTTLLLAYTGGFTTLILVFIAQGTPLVNLFNIQYVAAEILHTMVGSVGLVMVAPLTAAVGGWLLAPKPEVTPGASSNVMM